MKLDEFKRHLRRGQVYRRKDLMRWSSSVDRHLEQLRSNGTLQKVGPGLYYFPKETVFGKTPPKEETLLKQFLKEDHFLVTSPNAYNNLGVGTTQLYNKRIVYNRKRKGEYNLGNKNFSFRIKSRFPKKLTPEFLLVDLVNNLNTLAEDQREILKNVYSKVKTMNVDELRNSVQAYGTSRTKRLLDPVINQVEPKLYAA